MNHVAWTCKWIIFFFFASIFSRYIETMEKIYQNSAFRFKYTHTAHVLGIFTSRKFTVGLTCMHISVCVIFIFANVSHEMTTSSANHQLAFVCNRSSDLHMHTTTQSDTQFSPSNVTKKFIDKFSPAFFLYIQLNWS